MTDFYLNYPTDKLVVNKTHSILSNSNSLSFHHSLDCYKESPLINLENLSNKLNISKLCVKDESKRFDLNAFKVLGASYAVFETLKKYPNTSVFCTATDGNHGKAVAWSSRRYGKKTIVYVPNDTSSLRIEAIETFGATVHKLDLNYEQTCNYASKMSKKMNWQLIQDTSWENYEEIPSLIMAGYLTHFIEIDKFLEIKNLSNFDIIFLQCGVGSWAASCIWYHLNKYGKNLKLLGSCHGADLEGMNFQHPFLMKKVPIVCCDHVTTESGTGLVHTAPAHGLDDYIVGSKYELPIENPVNEHGCFKKNVPFFAGQTVWESNPNVIKLLKENDCLIHAESYAHSYPHCWRHKTPIIFRATPQWFIGMNNANSKKQTLRELSNKAVEATKFYPSWGRSRLESMIKNRPDWCVSRQRNWGVPIPIFLHKETSEPHPKTAHFFEAIAKKIEIEGMGAWFNLKIEEFLGKEAKEYIKISDTLDVWFDSGTTHESVLSKNKNLHCPADLYLEGSDQHRGWFQSSLLTSCAIN